MAMAEMDDIATQFAECCQRSREYPLTVMRTEVFRHTQKSLKARLDQDGLFNSSYKGLHVRDLHDTATEFDKGRTLKTLEDVETLLDPEEKDPWWRFMSARTLPVSWPAEADKKQIPSFADIKRSARLLQGTARTSSNIPSSHALVPRPRPHIQGSSTSPDPRSLPARKLLG